jgi:uncharacterized iron-regulated membrane protein
LEFEMPASNPVSIRTLCRTLHRWLGIGLAILLVPVSLSGALLVWHDHLDALLSPSRYAVSGPAVTHPPSAYVASASTALAGSAQPAAMRFPEQPGWPVIVMARGAASTEGGRPRIVNVYLDPPTARVLDVADFATSLIGWLRRFHENLTIPEYSGRAVVGWIGVAMLILSLTGIWLWWPRNGALIPGLRWRRSAYATANLHHLLGFWIAVPLAVVSATGIYLGFPQNARLLMASIAPMSPQAQRPGFGPLARDTRLTPDAALAAARAAQPDARPVAVFLPAGGGRGGGAQSGNRAQAGAEDGPLWRVQLRPADGDELVTITVNDRTGAAARLPDPLAGDRAARWIRAIHEGSRGGPLWQVMVFLTGVFPAIFVATGIVMWLRGRRRRRRALAGIGTGLQAAE